MTGAVTTGTSAYAWSNLQGAGLAQATKTAAAGSNSDSDNPLRELFSAMDADGDGVLSREDLASALSSAEDGGEIDIDLILELLDSDAGGSISENEFAQAFAPPPGPPPGSPAAADGSLEEEAEALLSSLDTDGDGVVSQEELAAAAGGVQTAELFSALDSDADGSLAAQELAAALQASRPPPPRPQGDDAAFSGAIASLAGAVGQRQAVSDTLTGQADEVAGVEDTGAALRTLAATSRGTGDSTEAADTIGLFRRLVVERYLSIAGNAQVDGSLSTTA